MKADEYKAAGLYRLNAMIPQYLGDQLDELTKPTGLNMKKKDIVAQALMEYVEKNKVRLDLLKK